MLKGLEAVTEHIVGQLKGLLCSALWTRKAPLAPAGRPRLWGRGRQQSKRVRIGPGHSIKHRTPVPFEFQINSESFFRVILCECSLLVSDTSSLRFNGALGVFICCVWQT